MTISNFLTPDVDQIRRSIRDIDDSYNNEWDILAELLQNAVDAIRESERAIGKITINVNSQNKVIEVIDDGVGIDQASLGVLLRPFSSKKGGDDRTVGEKGVGLTFAMFACEDFEIETGTGTSSAIGKVSGAKTWKLSNEHTQLNLEILSSDAAKVGTRITCRSVEAPALFGLSATQLAFVIRTRTAIGNTLGLFSQDIEIGTTLNHTDVDGVDESLSIPFSYQLPTEGLGSNDKIDLDSFRTWVEQSDRTDADKRIKLRNKIIFSQGEKLHGNNRKLHSFACFVPQRKAWEQISIRNGLVTDEQVKDLDWLEANWFTKFSSGIYSSVKGMPTGIRIDNPQTGWAGYWGNLFILIEDSILKFDIGRKSIHGRISSIHQSYAREIFNDFRNLVTKYVAGDVSQGQPSWDRDQIFTEIQSLVDNDLDSLRFQKTPFDQEASVAAIFYEALGAGLIKDINPLISGYKEKYDLYAKWGHRNIVCEFKSKLGNITNDFNDAQKYFDEIDAVICWEITDADRTRLNNIGINVDKIQQSVFGDDDEQNLPNATHIMSLGGARPVFVIDLKEHLGGSA